MPAQTPSTCLSEKPHDNRVSDPVTHFNSCLPARKRRRFYESLPPETQQRITRRNEKVLDLRQRLETTQYDSTAGARLRDFKQAMSQWNAALGRPHSSYTYQQSLGSESWRSPKLSEFGRADDSVNRHIKAPVIYFKNGQPFDVPGLPKSFPDQKVPMADLLSDDKTNPIMQPADDDVIRYFHLPANNMVWVEEIMARYYREKRPDPDEFASNSRRLKTRTELLLRPEYWQGQQNFDADSEIHARHMRSFFSTISIDPFSSEANPKNFALFLSYLHWETDRGRAKLAEIAKNISQNHLTSVSEVVDQAKHQFETPDTSVPAWASPPLPMASPVRSNVEKRKALGQVLRAAAALLEAMDLHTEEQLMKEYLHAQPPLHPRRTLDQAYYGALRSTRARDRDQVVYRGTTPEPHNCIGMDSCPQCNEDIRKTPRLIMVDQLWLWVLDERTVITSFPRRWGRHKPDPSAVHKSIRMRLKNVRQGEIANVYDLALLIVDETSRVFFDRTKTNQRQPNLVELFNGAIRDLTYKQTAAFDQFLIYTHLASREYKRQRYASFDNSNQNNLLNINPEGELLKEVKDVQDELKILITIMEQQATVTKLMVKQIRRELVPLACPKRPISSQSSVSWDAETASAYDIPIDDESEDQRRQSANRTLLRANTVLSDLNDRISELRNLLSNAQHTSASLKDLLTLKQQQAGVIEAREAVKQAQLTLKQGQSIMIFTVVTIIFLPLSFIASVFGMNAREFTTDSHMPLSTEFKLMFPVSAAIIVTSFLFAFSRSVFSNSVVTLVGSAVSFAWNTGVTWVLVKSGLYVLGREWQVKANRLREREGRVTGNMKAEVLRREKNLERMRAAGHVRELARTRSAGGVDAGRGERAGTPFSPPYSASIPGSPSPFLATSRSSSTLFQGKGVAPVGVAEVDVELGERISRKPSSQRHLTLPG